MSIAAKLLIAGAVLSVATATGQAAAVRPMQAAMRGIHIPHGLPNPTPLHVCRVFKRYGGGVCTSPPYAPLGRDCSCEGPHGPRPGVVTWR